MKNAYIFSKLVYTQSNIVYSRIDGFTIFLIFSMFIRSILSGEGDNLFPMKVLGIGTLLNIILDPIFIYYFQKIDRGIEGAAIATVLSQLIVSIF